MGRGWLGFGVLQLNFWTVQGKMTDCLSFGAGFFFWWGCVFFVAGLDDCHFAAGDGRGEGLWFLDALRELSVVSFLILSFLSLFCLGFGAVLCPGSDLSLVRHGARGPVLDETLGQSLTAVAGDYG